MGLKSFLPKQSLKLVDSICFPSEVKVKKIETLKSEIRNQLQLDTLVRISNSLKNNLKLVL